MYQKKKRNKKKRGERKEKTFPVGNGLYIKQRIPFLMSEKISLLVSD